MMITRRRASAAAATLALAVGLSTLGAGAANAWAPVIPDVDIAANSSQAGNCVYRTTRTASSGDDFDFTWHYEREGGSTGAVLLETTYNGQRVPGNSNGFWWESDHSTSGFFHIKAAPIYEKYGTYKFRVYTGHKDYRCKELELTVEVQRNRTYEQLKKLIEDIHRPWRS